MKQYLGKKSVSSARLPYLDRICVVETVVCAVDCLHPPDVGRTHCCSCDKGSLDVMLRLQLSNSANKNIFHLAGSPPLAENVTPG